MSFLRNIFFLWLVVGNPMLLGSLATSLFSDSFLEKGSNEPEFVEAIKNITVPAGREAVLSCVVSNLGKYKIGWLRAEDQTILTLDTRVVTHNLRISVTHDGVQTWNLHLRQIRESDRGCYMCQINTALMRKTVGCIDVHVSPTIVDEETSADLTVREGDNVTLVCKANGRPHPKIIWKREDGENIMLRRKGFRDGYKTKSKRIVLDVNFQPVIKVKNQLLGSPFGTDLTLTCEIEAMPKPFVYWVKNRGEMLIDGMGLKNSSKYTIEEERKSYKITSNLIIRNFGQKEAGMYSCVATNSLGKAEGSIRVHEIRLNKATSAATEHLVTLSAGYATPPISTEGHLRHNNNRESHWSSYDVVRDRGEVVMTPHDPQSEVNRNDISAIAASVAATSLKAKITVIIPSLSILSFSFSSHSQSFMR